MNFSDLHLIPPILRAAGEAGYETPSPIQQKAIPPVLAGRDLLGCAQTGTGKTAAFAMPILQRLYETPAPHSDSGGAQHGDLQQGGARQNSARQGGAAQDKTRRGGTQPKNALPGGTRAGAVRPIRALILTPTRELALQIDESFADYGRHLPLAHCVIFGGVNQNPQVEQLQKGVDILTATPGRLNDLIGQGYIDLGRIEIFVLDEADRMLDMGFVHDVKRVITHLPQKRQTLLFSATMPREIEELADSLLHNPAKVMVAPPATTVESIEQSVYFVDKGNKRHLLAKLLQNPDVTSALVFTRTKHGADRVVRELARAGIGAMAIHGNKSQNARQNALGSFKDGRIRVLVATDIAARGIDITGLSHVFNYDLPNIPETYVHRIGRTGRAGRAGIAISFCDFEEQEYLADIEKLTHIRIPSVEHEWPMQIFEKPEKQAQQPRTRAQQSSGARQADGAKQTPLPGAHQPQDVGTRRNMPAASGAQQNADLSLQKGERWMKQKNNAPHPRANGKATDAPLAAENPAAAGTASAAGNPAAASAATPSAAGAAQPDSGKKRRRRGGRRHKSGAQKAAAQAMPQAAPQAAPQQSKQGNAAQNVPDAGQKQAAKNGQNAGQGRTTKNGQNAGQSQAAKNGPNAGQSQAAKSGPNAGQNPAANDTPRAGQNRAAKSGPNIGQTRAPKETPRAETASAQPSAERDDSLQVISRRTPAQKYASFEDYMKAHE